MTKTLNEYSDIDTLGNVEAHNLGFMSHTNSYRSLKDKPHIPNPPFEVESITTSYISLTNDAKTGSVSAYTSAHPKSKYRALGVFGYRLSNDSAGKNCSYVRVLGSYLNGDNVNYALSNRYVTKTCKWHDQAFHKSSVASKFKLTVYVLYTHSDAYIEELSRTNIECSRVRDIDGKKELWFYAGTNHNPPVNADGSNLKLKKYNGSSWVETSFTVNEVKEDHCLITTTDVESIEKMKYFRVLIT